MKQITLSIGMMNNQCYVLIDEQTGKAAVIDIPRDPDLILNTLQQENAVCSALLLTHSHFDHVEGVDRVREATGAPLMIHKDDAESMLLPFRKGKYAFVDKPADVLLSGGDVIEIGSFALHVLHTPGHSPGSVCYLAGDCLFSGDTLFYETVGRCDFPGGSLAAIRTSITQKLYTLPGGTKVFPGHGQPTTIAHEKLYNDYVRAENP